MEYPSEEDLLRSRKLMVQTQLRARGIRDERVLAAMEQVPRHPFVSETNHAVAYEDHPVSIGSGQTISQPYIVALMLQALDVEQTHQVLEIGSGTGYQAAVLSQIARSVVTVERVPELADRAESNLNALGYATNIRVVRGDGTSGAPEHAPFDRIIVAAATPEVPRPLLEQLSPGGKMVVPVGKLDVQELQLITLTETGAISTSLGGCRFVPLLGEHGF